MKKKTANKNFILQITLQRNLQSVAREKKELYISRARYGNWEHIPTKRKQMLVLVLFF